MEKETFSLSSFHSKADSSGINAAAVLESIAKATESGFSKQFHPVIELARNLPAYSGNILELHFDRPGCWFDFAFRINKQYDSPLLTPALLQNKIAPFIQKGLDQLFQNPMPGFRYGIGNVWVEYDFPFQTAPALFFDLHRDEAFLPERTYRDLKKLATVFQYPISEELPGFLTTIKQLRLKVVYYGLMLSRKGASIRLTLEGVEAAGIIGTVRKLSWTGNDEALIELQKDYLRPNQRIVLCVDFDNILGSKLGLEVHDRDPNAFLEKTATNRRCEERYLDLLKSWPGKTALSLPLSRALSALHQRTVSCVYRRINHIKFTIDKDTINTKAYLYYCF